MKRLEQLQAFKKIYAPFDGVITARNTDIGALIGIGQRRRSCSTSRRRTSFASTSTCRRIYSRAARPGLAGGHRAERDCRAQRFKGTLGADGAVDRSDELAHAARGDRSRQSRRASCCRARSREVHLKLPTRASTFRLPVNALIFRAEGVRVAVVNDRRRGAGPGHARTRFRQHGRGPRGPDGRRVVIVNPPDSLTAGQIVACARPMPPAGARSRECGRRRSCIALALSACANKATYTPPAPSQIPPAFKENADWKAAQPADQTVRGAWWEVFQDAQLNALEARIDVSNETLKAQQARFRAGARRDRDQPGGSLSAGHDVAVDHTNRVVGQPRERHRASAHLGLRAAGGRARTRPTSGGGSAMRSTPAVRARRPAPPTSSRSGSRCTPSWRSTTSSCAASRPTSRSSTPPSRRSSARWS